MSADLTIVWTVWETWKLTRPGSRVTKVAYLWASSLVSTVVSHKL